MMHILYKDIININDEKKVFCLGCLVGFIFFGILYGYDILNPFYIEWFKNTGGDPYQHYVGWFWFSNESLHWPLGKIENLLYPLGSSVVFTDSIPWMAIPCKFIVNLFNAQNNIQYFGIYGLISFGLQGGFSALILNRYISNSYISVAGAIVFCCSYPLLIRMFGHTALGGGQWMILGAFAISIYNQQVSFRTYLLWSIVCSIAMCNHPYIGIMIGFIFLHFVFKIGLCKNIPIKSCMKLLFVVGSITIGAFYLVGGFIGNANPSGLYGNASLNINSLFNNYGSSNMFSDYLNLPVAPIIFQKEGAQYLGGGIICFLPIAVISFIRSLKNRNVNIGVLKLSCTFIFVILVLALSNKVYCGDILIFSYEIPDFIMSKLDVFRSSGRLFWPVYYVIMLFSIIYTYKICNNRRIASFLVLVLITLQLYDMEPFMYGTHKSMVNRKDLPNISLDLENWKSFMNEIKMINTFTLSGKADDSLRFMELSAKYNMKLDTTYGSHMDMVKWGTYAQEKMKKYNELKEIPANEMFLPLNKYIFVDMVSAVTNESNLWIKKDGYIFAVNKSISHYFKNEEIINDIYKISFNEYYNKTVNKDGEILFLVSVGDGFTKFSDENIKVLTDSGIKSDLSKTNKYSFIAIYNKNDVLYEKSELGKSEYAYHIKDDNKTITLKSCPGNYEKIEDVCSNLEGEILMPQVSCIATIYVYSKEKANVVEVAYVKDNGDTYVIPYEYVSNLAL